MEDFNKYGWTAMHEAAYKGYTNALPRFINYAKDTDKMFLLEIKTQDDLKATPLLTAALGGHLDCMKLLIDAGASIDEIIKYKSRYDHGLVEIACIRQDTNIILYLYEKFNYQLNICKKICSLMTFEGNDDEIRASLGRTLELVTQKTLAKPIEIKLRDDLLLKTGDNFPKAYTSYLKQSYKMDESLSCCTIIMINILHIPELRKYFHTNNIIQYYVDCLVIQQKKLLTENENLKLLTKQKLEQMIDNIDYELQLQTIVDNIDNLSFPLITLGEAFVELSKYSEFVDLIVREQYYEKLIPFVKLLFEMNNMRKRHPTIVYSNTNGTGDNANKVILFEQYIHLYLMCLGNLLAVNDHCKILFNDLSLYEHIMNLWSYIHLNSKFSSQNGSTIERLLSASTNVDEFKLLDRRSALSNQSTKKSDTSNDKNSVVNHKVAWNRLNNMLISQSKVLSFDHVPVYLLNANIGIENPNETPQIINNNLIRLIKLSIIECIGKAFCNNHSLKVAFLYRSYISSSGNNASANFSSKTISYLFTDRNWFNITSTFLHSLIEFVDTNRPVDKEIRITILKFFTLLFSGDKLAVEQLMNYRNPLTSSLITTLKNLLLKSCAIQIREEAIRLVWTLTGSEDELNTSANEKLFVYKAIGTQKFIDALCDSDYLSLIGLEGLDVIASAPPFREQAEFNHEQLFIKSTEEIDRTHAIPTIVRLLKSRNEELLFQTLQIINKCCYTVGYENNFRNQLQFSKLGAIQIINEIAQKRKISNKKLRYEAFLCMSSLSINNNLTRNLIYKQFNNGIVGLIETLYSNFIGISYTRDDTANSPLQEHPSDKNNEQSLRESKMIMSEIEDRINIGLALCGFFHRNEEFKAKLLEIFNKIPWIIYCDLLNLLISQEALVKNANDNVSYLKCLKLKCQLAFQMVFLYSVIDSKSTRDIFNENNNEGANEDDDPRATGIKLLINLIRNSYNTVLSAMAVDYLCRLINSDRTLVEPIIAIDCIEIICDKIAQKNSSTHAMCDMEIGYSAVLLGFLTEFSPEARRRILKCARKVPHVMSEVQYYNKVINIDLMTQWKHYEKLLDIVKTQQPLKASTPRKTGDNLQITSMSKPFMSKTVVTPISKPIVSSLNKPPAKIPTKLPKIKT